MYICITHTYTNRERRVSLPSRVFESACHTLRCMSARSRLALIPQRGNNHHADSERDAPADDRTASAARDSQVRYTASVGGSVPTEERHSAALGGNVHNMPGESMQSEVPHTSETVALGEAAFAWNDDRLQV